MDKLVSIVVLSYNCKNFIEDTLDSIKNQTYENIELIINDDFSKDDSIFVIEKWIEKNKSRFCNVYLHINNENRGTTYSCNNALKMANGEFIKFLAADDILKKEYVSKNINYINKHKNINFLFSNAERFNSDTDEILGYSVGKKELKCFKLDAKEQYKKLVVDNFCCAPTAFIRKSKLVEINGFDEEYRIMEDYPLWVKATRKMEKLYYMDEVEVRYRIHTKSITRGKGDSCYPILDYEKCKFYQEHRRNVLKRNRNFLDIYHNDIESYVFKKVWDRGNKKGDIKIIDKLILYFDLIHVKNQILARIKKLSFVVREKF